jgi:SAM-dependent methyltransferase
MTREALATLRLSARSLARHVREWYRESSQWPWFWQCYREYERSCHAPADGRAPQTTPAGTGAPGDGRGLPSLGDLYPCLTDATAETPLEPIYFYQGCWAFERIFARRPERHVDVASDAFFVALLSKVVPVTMVDIRPLPLSIPSLEFRKGSVLALPFADGSLPSVSSICVIEHIGLGRYGDPIDPWGTEKSLAELKRVVRPGGDLYLSVPLDDERRTYFNAHRAFTEPYLLEIFRPFDVIDRKYIFGQSFGDVIGSGFGTGCYHLRRPA